MSVKWTDEQQKVINLRGCNILVSAAAGSGKTAVLVERIITRLTKDEDPLDVDQLLIVTFTEAAAAEMKDRIAAAIEKALAENPTNLHLKRQSALIHTAKITTIHSFCLSVIRDYFHTIDLDPGFRIGDEGELKLLRQEVLEELMENKYQSQDERYLNFIESFATGRDDVAVGELIQHLYEFAGSYPDADEWLDHCVEVYRQGFAGSQMEDLIENYTKLIVQDVKENMRVVERICEEPSGPAVYMDTIQKDRELLKPLFQADQFEEIRAALEKMGGWPRLATNKNKEVDPGLSDMVKKLRANWKGQVDDLGKQFFFQTAEEMERDMKRCVPVMEELADLVKDFSNLFAQKKAEKNMIDFHDMEHFALKILTRKEEGRLVPSETAKEYQKQFREIMIDEYQDSNYLQEAILTSVSRMSAGEHNLFMVGDVKQSIYRFRLSRPELFMEKFDTYSMENGENQRIDLHKNFRSRGEVLESANDLFRRIMTQCLGKIEYDENAALYVGADYPKECGNQTELILVETKAEEDLAGEKENPRQREARVVAARIRELMKVQRVWDAKKQTFRGLQYRDIVILTRSIENWADVFAKTLDEEGIPAYTGSKSGYFSTLEISWLMDYLKVLDNMCQDIPLAAVMKSPFGNFSNEELAQIRLAWPKEAFHKAFRLTADGEVSEDAKISEDLRIKTKRLYQELLHYRSILAYTSISDLIFRITSETGYRDFVAVMPGGEQRAANLEMLLSKAKAFESTSYKGLFHFVRYISNLKKCDVDYGEAGIYDEETNAVRIMSIHKSKGLEFPVVIVAGMGKRFNMQDVNSNLVIHPEYGIGLEAVDLQMRTKSPSILKKIIQKETRIESLGEELRVLYVAMTRAKEKLILTGAIGKAREKLEEFEQMYAGYEGALSFGTLFQAGTYLDWILPAVKAMGGMSLIDVSIAGLCEVQEEAFAQEIESNIKIEEFLQNVEDEKSKYYRENPEFAQRLAEQFAYQYPFDGEEQLKLKYSVSELKKKEMHLGEMEEQASFAKEEEVVPLIPKFRQKKTELAGAGRGTAYHRFLELLDFSRDYDAEALKQWKEQCLVKGMMEEDEINCIDNEEILKFLRSDSGRRMARAAKNGFLYKEQPFVFGVDARELYPETDKEELVLIQGIIDVYFEEDGELVVLDYKTDHVYQAKELSDRYAKQLELYARALGQMTGKNVKQQIIYSFCLEEEILL